MSNPPLHKCKDPYWRFSGGRFWSVKEWCSSKQKNADYVDVSSNPWSWFISACPSPTHEQSSLKRQLSLSGGRHVRWRSDISCPETSSETSPPPCIRTYGNIKRDAETDSRWADEYLHALSCFFIFQLLQTFRSLIVTRSTLVKSTVE